ncbi:MAG TPA: branched-chain-amino-acid transaminase [Candidatus Dormibacteraeota bacterium]
MSEATPKNTWLNGRIVPWAESNIHVSSDAVLRGASVFEGIRAYRADGSDDLLIFRARDHMKRLFGTSMRVLRIDIPYTAEQLIEAMAELLRANEVHEDAHLRVVAYFDAVEWGKDAEGTTGAYILAYPRPRGARYEKGVRCLLSTWRRPSENAMSPRVKASANYLNSRVAMVDAQLKGYDMPILLNESGKVAEGAGQNLFIVRDGVVVTPAKTEAILEGVTRDTVLRLAAQLELPVQEREVDPTELYVAEEAFFAGTAAEVMPIVEIDNYAVGGGRPGPVTRQLQSAYDDLVRGRVEAPADWRVRVSAKAPVA